MKMIFKFKSGERVRVEDLAGVAGEGDILRNLIKLKETNGPIEVNLETGGKFVSRGKELASVEIVFE